MDTPPAPPEGVNIIGLAYQIGPSGATFDPAVTITFRYDKSKIPAGVNEEDLILAFYDATAGEWVQLSNIVVDPVHHTITGSVNHFTPFAVITPAPAPAPVPVPASFTTANLVITPAVILPGETATIKATVINSGDLTGTYTVTLRVGGSVIETKNISVAGNSSADVNFSVTSKIPGDVTIDINGLSGKLTIKQPVETTTSVLAEMKPAPAPTTTTAAPPAPASAEPAWPPAPASVPESHKRDAEQFARAFGLKHEYITSHEFDNPLYAANNPDRCFHCKDELFGRLEEFGRQRGIQHIVYGVNVDDLGDYRPGQNAAANHNVKAPLVEAGLRKAEIRELSRLAGLPTWDRPAAACLASRIPYGTPVTVETVKTVERGEEAVKALGFRQFRVRYHGELARIEVAPDEMPKALTIEMARKLTAIFKDLGFKYVTLDLQGYRQGSLNETLPNRNAGRA
jgi:uncharacterized protein